MSKKLLCFVLTFIIATSTVALGYDSFDANISYTSENAEITIAGNYDGAISITIAPESLAPAEMSSAATPTVFKQIEASGAYTCNIGMPLWASGGKYKVYVASADCETSATIVHINKQQASELVELLLKKDGNEFYEMVLSNTLTLGIDDSDILFVQKQKDILEMLDNMKYVGAGGFGSMYNKAYALSAIEGASADKVQSYLFKHQKALGIDYADDFSSDGRMSDEAKNKLTVLLSKVDYSTKINPAGDVNFKSIFNEYKPFAAILAAHNWLDLKNIITVDFASDFSSMLSSSDYSKVKDKDSVFAQMIGTEFALLSDVTVAFNKACTEILREEREQSSGGGSGATSAKSHGVTTPITPSQNNPVKELFSDLPQTHWSYEAVNLLASSGIISGYANGTFLPDKEITRAEFAKIVSAFINEDSDLKPMDFEDIIIGDWYYACISKASAKGLIKGDGLRFNPNNPIKREDAALIIYRLLVDMGKTPLGYKPFDDRNDISAYAKDAVYALGGAGIVNGNGYDKFLPQTSLTRAETAQMIYNAVYN